MKYFRIAIVLCLLLGVGLVPTTAQGECSGDVIELEFMNWWLASRVELMDEVIANFEAENPCIDVVNAPSTWENRAEIVATAMVGSNPPEIMMTNRAETYQFAAEGLIVPITSFVEEAGVDLSVFYEGEVGLQYWEGELYGLPMPTAGGLTSIALYNKTLLEEAGFDPESPPETWQELEEMSRAITEADPLGIEVLGHSIIGAEVGGESFVSWLYTNDGQYASEDGRTLLFNSPEGIETLEWMLNFVNEINGGVENVTDFYQDALFQEGDHPWYENRIAFEPVNTSAFGHLNNSDPDFYADTDRWGVMLRPYNGNNPDATHAGITGYSLSGAWAYTIPAVHPPEVQAAAYQFAEYLGTAELGGCAFLLAQSRPSPVRECNENPVYYEINPYWDVVLAGLATDVPVAITPVQGEISEILDTKIEEAFFGVKSAEEALNEAAEEGQAILDQFWSEQDG